MNAYENASATHRAMVDELLADTAKNGGLARHYTGLTLAELGREIGAVR